MSAYSEGGWASAGAHAWTMRVPTMRGTQAHHGWRGWVARRVPGSRSDERQPCGHFHQKRSAARKCAEQTARRLNRQAAR